MGLLPLLLILILTGVCMKETGYGVTHIFLVPGKVRTRNVHYYVKVIVFKVSVYSYKFVVGIFLRFVFIWLFNPQICFLCWKRRYHKSVVPCSMVDVIFSIYISGHFIFFLNRLVRISHGSFNSILSYVRHMWRYHNPLRLCWALSIVYWVIIGAYYKGAFV